MDTTPIGIIRDPALLDPAPAPSSGSTADRA
jgi:hypothetical protein